MTVSQLPSHPDDPLPSFGLAPMEGVTDWPARIWFHQTSAPAFMWTPFLRVTESFPARELPATWCPEIQQPPPNQEHVVPVIPQLMATNPRDFSRVATMVLHAANASGLDLPFVDLNCGCPSPVVVGGKAGSSLLEDPRSLRAFLDIAIRQLGCGRVSVKVRTGFHDAAEFHGILESLHGLALGQLAVHGRTRPQRYLGRADAGAVALAARQLPGVAVVGSGDICDLASARSAVASAPGAQKWITGRGALRNPWIFSELRSGAPVMIGLDALAFAIQTFALLHELHWDSPEALLALWRAGVFHAEPAAGTDPARWDRLLARIGQGLPGGSPRPGRRACARTKMLWNYLRSSLPVPLRDGILLRSATVEELVAGLSDLWRTHLGEQTALLHDPSWDWVYNGSGKPSPTGSSLEANRGVQKS